MALTPVAEGINVALVLAVAEQRKRRENCRTVDDALLAMGITRSEEDLRRTGGQIALDFTALMQRSSAVFADELYKLYVGGEYLLQEIKFAGLCFDNCPQIRRLQEAAVTIDELLKGNPRSKLSYEKTAPAPLPASIDDPQFRDKLLSDLEAALACTYRRTTFWEGCAGAVVKTGNLIRTGKLAAPIASAFLVGVANGDISPYSGSDLDWANRQSLAANLRNNLGIFRSGNHLRLEEITDETFLNPWNDFLEKRR